MIRPTLARCALALASLVPSAPSLAFQLPPQPEPTALEQTLERARSWAEGLRDEHALPGLSVAVAVDGRLVLAEGFGFADLEQRVAVTSDTRFRIGSVSKLLTAAAVARLWQEDAVDLDAPVRQYVPYWPEKAHTIAVDQLAAHTSGIPHYGPEDDRATLRYRPEVREGVRVFASLPLAFEPGTAYRYSSYGYNLLSAVVEGASGKDFVHYLRASVLEPVGMFATVPDDRFRVIPHRTRFYLRLDGGLVVNAPAVDCSHKWGSGGYLSTAEDLVRFGLAHVDSDLFREDTLEMMFRPRPATSHPTFEVGLGWRISEGDRGRVYHHGGASEGARAFIAVWPESRSVVVLLANLFANLGLDEARELLGIFV